MGVSFRPHPIVPAGKQGDGPTLEAALRPHDQAEDAKIRQVKLHGGVDAERLDIVLDGVADFIGGLVANGVADQVGQLGVPQQMTAQLDVVRPGLGCIESEQSFGGCFIQRRWP